LQINDLQRSKADPGSAFSFPARVDASRATGCEFLARPSTAWMTHGSNRPRLTRMADPLRAPSTGHTPA
jgi:hypothetical protein